jgi:hypothetical protein
MSAITFLFFGTWIAFLVGAALAIVGLDVWVSHRRDVVRKAKGVAK